MTVAIDQLNSALSLILPDVILLATMCLMFFAAPFLVSERGEAPAGLRDRWGWLSLLGLGVAGYLWWNSSPQPVTTGPFRLDDLAWYVRGLSLGIGAVLVLVTWNQADDARSAETQACLLAIIAGVNLVAASNDLVGLFVALELISVPTYLFLLMPRRDAPAQEATIKYFLLSVLSSAFLLFGLSYLYGATGTTNLQAIHAALARSTSPDMPMILGISVVMMVAGLAFRLTAVPFHFYAPDVFQGAPNSAAAMLSVMPKVAGFVALYRVLAWPLSGGEWSLGEFAEPLLWWIAVLTMFVGNLLALLQTDIRRLLAFSSVSHAGYMLVGFVVGGKTSATVNGFEAVLFYLAVYGAMTLGVFAALAALNRPERRIATLEDLQGLSRVRPGLALVLTVFLLSLTGLPPTAGFLGKLNLFLAAWGTGTESGCWLAIWLAVNAAIGAWYYLRVIREMYLSEPVTPIEDQPATPALVAVGVCTVATLGLFFVPNILWAAIQRV
ncbi:MAG: NADH-quinone oxidoreductase subunit N [Planctomycetaceae bacterium]|nr:NADH-quinone oxidoreductase subunit N [Planctomycetaceae bacterium]